MIWLSALIAVTLICWLAWQRSVSSPPASDLDWLQHLPLDEAIRRVKGLQAEGAFLASPAPLSPALQNGLGPITRGFFEQYGAIRTPQGGFCLSASDIRPSEYVPGFLHIGHCEDWDVVQQAGQDQVFVVEGSERDASDMDGGHLSVYHLVLNEVLASRR